MNIDDKLYPIIENALGINHTINEDPELFNWIVK